jgi:mono/diheme cytochrome c family protein
MRTPGRSVRIALLAAGGCAGGDGPAGPLGAGVADGEAVYGTPLADGNSFSCATCHALEEPAPDGFRRPAHPLGDATRRPDYKNGELTDLLDAVNTCAVEWMNASPFTASDARFVALRSFLDAQAPPGEAPRVEIRIVEPPEELSGGDPAEGRAFFNGACAVCHGADARGTVRAPALAGAELEPEYIARRVRTSGRTDSGVYGGLTGGVMPFWGADRLSDDELLDVVAFVHDVSLGMLPGGGGPVETGPPPGGCDVTHPRVGQAAVLSRRFHDVGGTARIVDDCTIVIEDFTFDSRGIDVRVYGGLGGDYDRGFAIGDDLIRDRPYTGETLTVRLPADRTLDDLDGVSIWCVPVGVSFGDGLFR